MEFPNKETVARVRNDYIPGTFVELVEMTDPLREMPKGLHGIVRGVDDTGDLMMSWLNGSSLNVVYGVDQVRIIEKPLNIDDLYEMHGLPVCLIPADAYLPLDSRIGYYLVNASDQALIGVNKQLSFDHIESGKYYAYKRRVIV